MTLRRAFSDHQKQQRRDAMVAAARALFDTKDYDAVSMAEVARGAGVAKGTLYVYFPSKEALFLELCLREVRSFFASFDHALPPGRKRGGVDAVLDAIEAGFDEHPTFLRLVGLMHVVLEQNTDEHTALAFRTALLELFVRPAARLEHHLSFVGPGEGVRLILTVHAMTVGFQQVAQPSESFERLAKLADMPSLELDFPGSLLRALRFQLLGMQAAHRQKARARR